MKRFLILLLSVTLLFSSCKSKEVKSSISLNPDSLNTAFSLNLNDEKYEGIIKIAQNNSMEITLSKPESISGISFTVSENSVVTTYEGIVLNHSDLPVKNVFSEFLQTVEKLKTVTEYTPENGFYKYSSDSFCAMLDARGNIVNLNLKNGEFTFT